MWAATADYTPFLGVRAALAFFERAGRARIAGHCHALAAAAGAMLAERWGTGLLVPPQHCTSLCTVRVPQRRGGGGGSEGERGGGGGGGGGGGFGVDDPIGLNHALRARGIEVPCFAFNGQLYVRVSAHIHNEMAEYERLADAVLAIQQGDRRPS
jgi:isopenicillin-N epimerase